MLALLQNSFPSSKTYVAQHINRSPSVASATLNLSTNTKTERMHREGANGSTNLTSMLEIIRTWLSAMIIMLLMGSRYFQSFVRSTRLLTRSPSMLLDSNITLVDALNRELSLPYQHFRHWPVVLARLQCEFVGLPGESYVVGNKFGIFRAAKKPQNQVMIPFEQWGRSVFPGDRVLMSIDVEQLDPNECPSCGCALQEVHLLPVFSKCVECGQSVLTVRNDFMINGLRAPQTHGPDKQNDPSKKPDDTMDIQKFARIHGRQREKDPREPAVLDLTEESLALLEDSLSSCRRLNFVGARPAKYAFGRLGNKSSHSRAGVSSE